MFSIIEIHRKHLGECVDCVWYCMKNKYFILINYVLGARRIGAIISNIFAVCAHDTVLTQKCEMHFEHPYVYVDGCVKHADCEGFICFK